MKDREVRSSMLCDFRQLHMNPQCHIMLRALTAVVMVMGSAHSSPSQKSKNQISYFVHVNKTDLSGFDVEMTLDSARAPFRIAMASHPEYDDRYWRYVENLRAESNGVP